MEKKKEKWGKPKLIILVRGKPDEMVLAACKTYGGSGPNDIADGCDLADFTCNSCSSGAGS